MRFPEKAVALKVDVDTRRGMEQGVPALLGLFRRREVPAAFFLSFGPDRSGTAIWNVFKQRGFLRKMLRTNALRMYGLRTVLSGTLLPARPVASDYPDLVRRIEAEGHEVGVHAWDHRLWQDELDRLSPGEIREQMRRAAEAFERILGRMARSAAAPAWRVNRASLEAEDELGLLYASDCRGEGPFFPVLEGRAFRTPQFPTTIPCVEEIVAAGEDDHERILEALLGSLRGAALNIFPAHAEVEGTLYGGLLERFLEAARARGYRFVRLEDLVREALRGGKLPERRLVFQSVPGRASLVASPAA